MSFVKNFLSSCKKHWIICLVILIFLFGFYVRTLNYHWPYLRNIDSYTLYRQMDDIVQNGGSMPSYDSLMLAPEGTSRGFELYPYQYSAAWSYMFFHSLMPHLELWQYMIYYPAFLAALSAIPMYFIGKILYDRRAGVLAALFIIFDISNFSRSLAGDPDTDAIVILVPLVVMAVFLYTFKHLTLKKVFDKKAVLLTVLMGILLTLWTNIWIGYWYVIWLITGPIFAKFIIEVFEKRKIKIAWNDNKHMIFSYVIFIIMFFVLLIPIYGFSRIAYTFTGPIEFQSIKTEEGIPFPNVYVSVAELQQGGNIKEIIQRTSAVDFSQNPFALLISPFFFMIYGLVYLVYSYVKKKQHIDTIILMLIWFLGPLLATMMAVRFVMLFSAPMAICSAIFLSKAYRMIIGEDQKWED